MCGLLAARPRGTRPLVARAVFSCRLHAERSYLLAPQSTTMAATSEAPMVDEAILEKVAPLDPAPSRPPRVTTPPTLSLIAMPVPILNHAEFATLRPMRARACAQLQKLPENVGFVQSDDGEAQLAGVTWFRKILSIGAPAARGRPQNCQAAARLALCCLHCCILLYAQSVGRQSTKSSNRASSLVSYSS